MDQKSSDEALIASLAKDRAAQETHAQNLAAAQKRIQDHPMSLSHWETENLRAAISEVFVPNGIQLSEHFKRIENEPLLGLELIQNISRSEVADAYASELLRLFHNYLASAYTVSEYVEAINNRRKKRFKKSIDPLAGPYKSAREQFDKIPEVAVMSGLRSYVQHHSQSPFTFTGNFKNINTAEMTIEHRVLVLTSQLLQAPTFFNRKAVEFLASRPDVLLLEVVTAYTLAVSTFFGTYLGKLVEDAEPLLDEYNELRVAYNAVLSGTTLEEARVITERKTIEFNTPRPPFGSP